MNCPVCFKYFNSKENIPLYLNCCGQSFCYLCSKAESNEDCVLERCPLCSEEFNI
jgi:hypothetical protein